MKKNKFLNFLLIGLQTVLITGVTLCTAANVSCKISAEGIKLLKGDYESPELMGVKVSDSRTLMLWFNEKVNVTGCSVSVRKNQEEGETDAGSDGNLQESETDTPSEIYTEISYEENQTAVKVSFETAMALGTAYEIYGTVTDINGNSLTFAVPFTGFNASIPQLVMTEIQAKSVNSQTTKEKNAGTYRSEYVEFLALTDGNLCGLELLSGYDGEEKKYVFPAVEVSKGEVFTVHLRNRGNGCVSEEGNDKTLAASSYTSPSVRDLWSSQEETVLGNKTDVVILQNSFDGSVMDAAFYRSSSVESWSKDMETYAVKACESGLYDSFEPEAASLTDGITDTKTLSRTGAAALYQSVIKGEEIEYPVKCDQNSWYVSDASAGTL